jgi:ABC-2 type transport system permease protein
MRASWYSAKSYRLQLAMQVAGMVFTVVPMFFIAGALQSTMAGAIAGESTEFFSFVLVGSIALLFVSTAMTATQGAISGGISNGYFESLLMTRTPLPSLLIGLTSYGLVVTFVRATVILVAGAILGADIAWGQAASALLIIAVLFAVHWGIGLIAAALIIAFRTAGPLTQLVTTVSVFFGGVYYPTAAIPSWLGAIAEVTPLAYGLRALRRVLLLGESFSSVGADVAVVAAMGVVSLMAGAWAIGVALRYAKRAGTLSLY